MEKTDKKDVKRQFKPIKLDTKKILDDLKKRKGKSGYTPESPRLGPCGGCDIVMDR